MLIDTQTELDAFTQNLPDCPFVAIDTEFLRDKTYYPKLCLIQIGLPNGQDVAIDPLPNDLDLNAVFDLLRNENIVKVFHAARQDLEIFFNLMGALPAPLFDTQIAASVLGYGEQIGYNNLAQEICNIQLDKSRQFMDWSHRPLSQSQLDYALADVIHLKDIYDHLVNELNKKNRLAWALEETKFLEDVSLYENNPQHAWSRIKIRTHKSEDLQSLKALAAWRETLAQKKDIPKQRILRDEVLTQLAMIRPKKEDHFKRIRNLPQGYQTGHNAQMLMKVIHQSLEEPKEHWPQREKKPFNSNDTSAVLDMLKLLLKIQSEEHQVSAKIIASAEDLDKLAREDRPDIPAMKGWRYKVFGQEAEALKNGEITLSLAGAEIRKIRV